MTHRWDPRVTEVPALTRPVRLDNAGKNGPTRGQSRGPGWRQTSHGLYVPGTVSDESVEQRILEQSMRITENGAVTGWAALRLHGGNFFDGLAPDGVTRLPVPIAAGSGRIRSHPDIDLDRSRLDADEVVVLHGIRCTKTERALHDEMLRLEDPRERVVAVDMAAAAELTSIRRMRTYLVTRRGGRVLIALLDLADEHSRSPAETRFRLIWVLDAGWPHPLCNRPVYDLDGHHLGTPDLLDPDRGVAGEYDGADHRTAARHTEDVRREDAFRRAGLEYVEAVGADLHHRDRVVARMEAARSRAGRMPRAWTIEPPAYLVPPPSLDERLDLRDQILRERGGSAW